MDFFANNIYTIILAPLWVFLLIVLGRFFNVVQSRRVIGLITLASTLYGMFFAVGTFLFMMKTPDYVYENSFNFIKINDLALNLGVFVDNLSVVMLLLVTTVSFLVQLYSFNYMWKDKSFPRFFGYLNLFNFSMIGLVLSSNLFQNYIFWELVGVSSYLLIGFWYKKPSASNAAKKAFLMNRIGDFGLLAGTIAISYFMYQYSGDNSLASVPFLNINDVSNYLYSYTNDFVFVVICGFLLMGSIAKSAQFPLHTWLPDAMEGPTPVSALIHSATMVAAGVYLIARLYPIYSLSDGVMNFIAIIGLITALICAFFAITQNDLKRILAYSTCSQLGLMFLALGAGAYAGGIFHLITHAYFKSMLFLCSGVVIHCLAEQQDIRFMGGLRKYMPLTAICYLVGCVSASGILFSGFYSKELILTTLLQNNHQIYVGGFLIVALMTAFYMFRSYFVVFEGEYKGKSEPHKPSLVLNFPIAVLALITISICPVVKETFVHLIKFGNFVSQAAKEINPVFVSLTIAFTGLVAAFILYNTKLKAIKIPGLYQLSYNKFYIDNFYDFLTKKIYYMIAKISGFFDKYIIDGLVSASGYGVRAVSWIFSKMQTGNFQSYLSYSVAVLAIIFAGLMLAYTVIVQFSLLSGG